MKMMQMQLLQIITTITLISIASSVPLKMHYNVTQHYHTSKIDHFTTGTYAIHHLPNNNTYQQRYFSVNDYWDTQKGPVFLYLCGEYTCSFPDTRLFPLQIASQHAGRFLVLQHRYYGKSQPFESWQLENLDYLQVNQALADIAHFIEAQNQQYGERKWIVIGGSYPGALSAWFRYKYPHLTVGGWSSSGVVQAIESFDKFDEQVSHSVWKSGEKCYFQVKNWTDYLQFQLMMDDNQAKKIRQTFGLSSNDNNSEFMWFVSDIFTESVQYGGRTQLCQFLVNNQTSNTLQGLKWWADSRGVQWKDYRSKVAQNTTIDYSKNMRQWYFQMCAEVGFFQIPSKSYPTRSNWLNITFWQEYCNNMFGQEVWPDVNRTNTELGGDKLAVTNLVMINGAEDPWKWASKLPFNGAGNWHEQETDGVESFELMEAQCDNCAHCVELYTPDDEKDPDELKRVRLRIIELVDFWLGDSQVYTD